MVDDSTNRKTESERERNRLEQSSDNADRGESESTTTERGHNTPRRPVLRALGGASAVLGLSGIASAGGKGPKKDDEDEDKDKHETYNGYTKDHPAKDEDGDGLPEAPTPAEPEVDLGEEASVRFEAQVTDGSYVVAKDVVVPTAGFLSIHQLDGAEIDGEEFYYINEENGAPQNAAQTIVGGSDFLEPGIYDRVPVDIYEDDRRPLVAETGQDRLEFPKPLLALMHIDGNGNEEFELFDNDDIVDAAYDFGETDLTPPFDRPSDIATVVPLENNAEEFDIFVERGEIELRNGR